jgi:phosphatidate cytidylyltransferase
MNARIPKSHHDRLGNIYFEMFLETFFDRQPKNEPKDVIRSHIFGVDESSDVSLDRLDQCHSLPLPDCVSVKLCSLLLMWRGISFLLIFCSVTESRTSFTLNSPLIDVGKNQPTSLNHKVSNARSSDRIITGVSLATLTAGAIFSNRKIFPSALALASSLAQSEYSAIVSKKNVSTNSNFLSAATLLSFFVAYTSPALHTQLYPPLVFAMMIYFLFAKTELSSISEIAATLFGMTVIGYFPSYWVRLRNLGSTMHLTPPLQFASYIPTAVVPEGAILLFLTWAGLALSDVGAYVFGRLVGYHRLSDYFPCALGKASPKKTLEGLAGGLITSTLLWALVGRHFGQSPWQGAALGAVLSFVGFVGDVSVSLLKRDAGVKDSGALLQGHGGVLDRMDSYLLSAPLAFLFWKHCLPILKSGGDPVAVMGAALAALLDKKL